MNEDQRLLEQTLGRLAELRIERARLQETLDEIDRQIRALEDLAASEALRHAGFFAPPTARGGQRYGDVRREVIRLLAGSVQGLESAIIGRLVREHFGRRVSNRSHLTTLYRLRDAGLASKDGDRWRLTDAGAREALGFL